MYKIMDETGNVYRQHRYVKEDAFEAMVVKNADAIFGTDGIYFDVKRRAGAPKKDAAMPDGYYLDLTFHDDPRLYLVEIELVGHDTCGHIGEQILRFGIASETDKYKIKNILLKGITEDIIQKAKVIEYLKRSSFENANALFDKVVFGNKPAAIIIIDEATEELKNVLRQLTMATEVIEAQTYVCGERKLYRFTPFKDDILEDLPIGEDADDLNTIVVPAQADGFKEEFLHHHQWFAVRLKSAMLHKIKYIAAYQVAPVSGITHVAQVERIEKFKDSGKYIVHFKPDSIEKINKIGLGKKKALAPQAPRYTTYRAIMEAKTLDEIWHN